MQRISYRGDMIKFPGASQKSCSILSYLKTTDIRLTYSNIKIIAIVEIKQMYV